LPVGIMLVGRHFEETTVIQAAQALEQAGDWGPVE
jgi:amidase